MKKQKYQPDDKDESVKLYYEQIASEYENLRFKNSYGRYIDFQEREILNQWLLSLEKKNVFLLPSEINQNLTGSK